MLSCVQLALDRAKCDGIIVHVGTDVLAKRKRRSDIVDSVILVCKKC